MKSQSGLFKRSLYWVKKKPHNRKYAALSCINYKKKHFPISKLKLLKNHYYIPPACTNEGNSPIVHHPPSLSSTNKPALFHGQKAERRNRSWIGPTNPRVDDGLAEGKFPDHSLLNRNQTQLYRVLNSVNIVKISSFRTCICRVKRLTLGFIN